ncbi:unnamed protein product [Sphagnum compactum]
MGSGSGFFLPLVLFREEGGRRITSGKQKNIRRSLERKRKGGSFCVMGQGKIAQDGTSQFLALGAGFFALGYILGRQRAGRCKQCFTDSGAAATSKKRCIQDGKKEPLYIDRLAELHSDFKMVLIVRNDLKMGKGKLASQCSHATVGLYKKICNRAPKAVQRWETCGQAKVVTKVESEAELLSLQRQARRLKVPSHITTDAGLTQTNPNSRTVMALLGPVDLVDQVTGRLKLC